MTKGFTISAAALKFETGFSSSTNKQEAREGHVPLQTPALRTRRR